MTYAFIIALIAAVVLGIAFYFQMKASNKQTEEQKQLLADYQRRVDEQQKLLDDYRSLEKNFDSVGEGYEQALLAFDKMNEEQDKARAANEALQQKVGALQTENGKLADKIKRQSDSLAQVVTDLKDIAAEAGNSKIAALIGKLSDIDDLDADAPIDRTDNVMVTQIVDDAAKAAGADKVTYIQFTKDIAPDAAATMISTNAAKAARALTHLLDNALKFTTEGSVKVSAAVDMAKMQATYTVEDSGSGIAADDAERIFEPYVKLNQYFDGQGIGLTVARNIARRLGGDLVLDTAFAGPGARFVLTLPI